MKTQRSEQLFAEAQQIIPGGVNSPVRAFRSVGGQPRFIARAKGARLYDVDGNSYLDYVLSWGPMILGHAPATVTKAIQQAAANGTSYGAPTELEIQLATMIREALPSMEQVAEQYQGRVAFTKLDIDQSSSAPMTYGVSSLPTTVLFKGGQVVDRKLGAMSRDILDKWIAPHAR